MRSSVTSSVVIAGFVAGLASFYGCSSGDDGTPGNPFTNPTAGSAGTTTGTSGSGTGGSGTGGTGVLPTAGTTGTSGSAVGGTGTGGTGAGGMSGGGGAATTGGAGGGGGTGTGGGAGSDITKVAKSTGCGQDPAAAAGTHTIHTMGTKPAGCADSKCGAWAYDREYTVILPTPYDNMKAYPLVFEGPGCGGGSKDIYPLSIPYPNGPANAGNSVIRVGLKPPPNDIGHATNPNSGCFDDKEGDDSVDWTFYENLWDTVLDPKLCFDKNRVFASGNSSGAWFSNEVGCKYAGDSKHPIRGIMPNTGGLPTDIPSAMPVCSSKPLAGIWMGESHDPENDFVHNKAAMDRAMMVNGCTGTDIDKATFTDFAASNSSIACKKVVGCPDLYPIIMCLKDGNQHAGHDDSANPAFSSFLQMFSTGAFLTQ